MAKSRSGRPRKTRITPAARAAPAINIHANHVDVLDETPDNDQLMESFFDLQTSRPAASAQAIQHRDELCKLGDRDRLAIIRKTLERKSTDIDYNQISEKCIRSLDSGSNVLLVGLGSKQDLLMRFTNDNLNNLSCVVINGYCDVFSLSHLLSSISTRILSIKVARRDPLKQSTAIINALSADNRHIYLVVHNLDGPRFRSTKVQAVFARLAESKFVHMIATIDHIRTSLLWDSAIVNDFGFHIVVANTLAPYLAETVNADSARRKRASKHLGRPRHGNASGIDAILKSFTPRQKEALSNLAFSQLERDPEGLELMEWMEICNGTNERDFRILVDELRYQKLVEEFSHSITNAPTYKIVLDDDLIRSKLLMDDTI